LAKRSEAPSDTSPLGAAIRELRARKGLSQADLATTAGITRQYMNRVENTFCNVSASVVKRIALALGTTPSHLHAGAVSTVLDTSSVHDETTLDLAIAVLERMDEWAAGVTFRLRGLLAPELAERIASFRREIGMHLAMQHATDLGIPADASLATCRAKTTWDLAADLRSGLTEYHLLRDEVAAISGTKATLASPAYDSAVFATPIGNDPSTLLVSLAFRDGHPLTTILPVEVPIPWFFHLGDSEEYRVCRVEDQSLRSLGIDEGDVLVLAHIDESAVDVHGTLAIGVAREARRADDQLRHYAGQLRLTPSGWTVEIVPGRSLLAETKRFTSIKYAITAVLRPSLRGIVGNQIAQSSNADDRKE
jgi:transcriptional regulator with XRE-family HTH domain